MRCFERCQTIHGIQAAACSVACVAAALRLRSSIDGAEEVEERDLFPADTRHGPFLRINGISCHEAGRCLAVQQHLSLTRHLTA